MRKILVTGGAGFIGSHLVEFLSKKNKVIVIDNLSHGNKLKNFNKNIKLVKGDIRDFQLIDYYSRNCKSIFHLAAILGVDIVSKKNVETMECEFEGLKNICYAAKKNNIKKIIYSSSSGVYGKLNYKTKVKEEAIIAPASAYSMSKRLGEFYLNNFYKENSISSVVLRLFNVYGPRQDERMVIPRFITQALKNNPITVYGTGKDTRDFTYIDDCIKIFDLVNKKIEGFKVFNVSREYDYDINTLAKSIKNKLNSKSKIIHVKVPKRLEEFQVARRCGDSSKIYSFVKYKPNTPLEDGLNKIIEKLI